VPWLKRLAAGLSPGRHGFAPGLVYVGSVMNKVALGQFLSEFFGFPLTPGLHAIYHLEDEEPELSQQNLVNFLSSLMRATCPAHLIGLDLICLMISGDEYKL
jgi:hypothetical protein